MTVRKLMAIGLILALASAGWWVLGLSMAERTRQSNGRLGMAVENLWGQSLVQQAPSMSVEVPGSDHPRWIMPRENAIQVNLTTDYRQKGLIWYPTYNCTFQARYTIANSEEVAQKVRVHFDFPAKGGTYDAFAMAINGEEIRTPINTAEGVGEIIELAPGAQAAFEVSYTTRGLREWRYVMDPHIGRVRNLNLAVTTNFQEVDYPEGCLSPMKTEAASTGMMLTWHADDLITKESIGVIVPEKLNPGPLTSRIIFFAPVCLVFFFVLVGTINIVYEVNIHPMHYFFVAAGFFAFHILFAYLADVVPIHAGFVISSAVSVALVTGYLSAALRGKFPWKVAIGGQLFFLVLFSYSFFLDGMTGLTVAIGSVLTLAVLMKVTAHVNWDEVFASDRRPKAPIPPPIPPAAAATTGHAE